jgi:hypothetical protein
MIRIIYKIKTEDKEAELQWLKEQKIFPGVDDYVDWGTRVTMTRVGVIVTPEAALSIKLRHKLDLQIDYHK